jgi:beta-glucanase (GH16 family)
VEPTAPVDPTTPEEPDTTPPSAPTGLSFSNVSQSHATLTWNPSTDNIGVNAYVVVQDGVQLEVVDALSTTIPVNCGESTSIVIAAVDEAGNHATGAPGTLTAAACDDTSAPTAPTGLVAPLVTADSAKLIWNAASDDVGVASYVVYSGGSEIATSMQNSVTVPVSCGQTHRYTVTALDGAGNESTDSAPASVTTPPCADTSAPTAPGSPAASSVTATSATLAWKAATDDNGVDHYEIFAATSKLGSATGTTFSVPLSCGKSSLFSIYAVDGAGNRSAAANVSATGSSCADTAAPTTPGGLKASSITATSAVLSWNASIDNVAVDHYVIESSDVLQGTAESTTFTVKLTCGAARTFDVTAIDDSGNLSDAASLNVSAASCVDTTAPATPTGLASSAVTETSAKLTWNPASDNVAVDHYDVISGGVALGSVKTTTFTAALTCGTTASFNVIAFDAAGNASSGAPISVSAAACPSVPNEPSGNPAPVGVAGSWTLKFKDEFNGSSLDTSIWDTQRGKDNAHYGDPYNPDIEDAYYKDSNTSVSKGSLVLTLKDESSNGYPATSGLIDSGNSYSYKYGYIESRIKVPRCDGCWPAFWMLDAPVDDHWPPEIDIFEFFNTNGDDQPHFNYHWNDGGLRQSGPSTYGDSGTDYTADWHTYGFLWTASKLQVYIDGKPGPSYTDASKITQTANYIIFNLGHYRGSSVQNGAQMLVDYVRVWQ